MEKESCRNGWWCWIIRISLYFKKVQCKKTLHNGRSHINAEHYRDFCNMLNTLRKPGEIVSVMMLTVELRRITGAPVSLHVLSKHVACWLVSVRFVQCHITHVAQNTRYCEIAMQDFTNYINSELVLGQYRQACLVILMRLKFSLIWKVDTPWQEKGQDYVPKNYRDYYAMYCSAWGYNEWGDTDSIGGFQGQARWEFC